MKDFDMWNGMKKKLDEVRRDFLFKEGEIWWCAIGMNVGDEVYGKGEKFGRPVIIFKRLSSRICIVIPTTTKSKNGSWFHYLYVRGIHRWAMMNHIKSISTNRFLKRESRMSLEQFQQLKKSVALLLGLSFNDHRA